MLSHIEPPTAYLIHLKTEFHRNDEGRAAAVDGYPSACFRGSGCTPHFPSGARPKSMTALVSLRCTHFIALPHAPPFYAVTRLFRATTDYRFR